MKSCYILFILKYNKILFQIKYLIKIQKIKNELEKDNASKNSILTMNIHNNIKMDHEFNIEIKKERMDLQIFQDFPNNPDIC